MALKLYTKLIKIAKKKKLKKLKAGVYEQNLASQKVLKKMVLKLKADLNTKKYIMADDILILNMEKF